jgi:hypothetical protein
MDPDGLAQAVVFAGSDGTPNSHPDGVQPWLGRTASYCRVTAAVHIVSGSTCKVPDQDGRYRTASRVACKASSSGIGTGLVRRMPWDKRPSRFPTTAAMLRCVLFSFSRKKNSTDLAIWTHEFSHGGGPYIAAKKKSPAACSVNFSAATPQESGIWGSRGLRLDSAKNKKSPTMCSANVAPRPRRKWDLEPRGLRLNAGEKRREAPRCALLTFAGCWSGDFLAAIKKSGWMPGTKQGAARRTLDSAHQKLRVRLHRIRRTCRASAPTAVAWGVAPPPGVEAVRQMQASSRSRRR